jgi:hypothetical protein
MYIHDSGQLGFPNFLLPFEGHHDKMLRLLFFTLFPAGAVMRFWGLAHAQRFQNPTGVFFLRAGSAERMSLVASQAVLLQSA